MNDLISRQDTLKRLCEKCTEGLEVSACGKWKCIEYRLIEDMPSADILNNKVHLCNSCQHNYPDCSAKQDDIIFGDGTGSDNICCCAKYETADRPQGKWIRISNDWIDGTCGARYFPIRCSICGYSTYDDDATKFCPNCGARMWVHDE